ncbi:Bicyclomycin resistance protein [Penicillium crustosum]|uniref:Bicyclomycin resistance protein n=1 Tax=Penicillium crustosum TaxID=36656 RepID=UPI002399160C|nr:Bicyclomycin resistance protein [Penicillium crustosum]KAJ5394878.1 Bicyclomycin resistance protein [Penicillium crustosum]
MMLGLMTICVTFGSSVFSTATKQTAKKFGVSSEVMVLGVSLFVLGFAFGPIIFGPLSELYGRKRPLFLGMFVFAIFQIPVAVALNLQTLFICRFLGGLFASAPLAIVSGILADMFEPVERGIAMAIFAAATFIGPVAGPIVGLETPAYRLNFQSLEQCTEGDVTHDFFQNICPLVELSFGDLSYSITHPGDPPHTSVRGGPKLKPRALVGSDISDRKIVDYQLTMAHRKPYLEGAATIGEFKRPRVIRRREWTLERSPSSTTKRLMQEIRGYVLSTF